LLALLLVAAFGLLAPNASNSVNELGDGLTWRLSDKHLEERRVVVVDIDEKSVQALGPWPWSRQTFSRLVDGLNHYNVGLKVYDIVLPDAKQGDSELMGAFAAGGPNVLGQVFSLTPDIRVASGQPYGGFDLGPCPSIAAKGYGFIANQSSLMGGNATSGHISPIVDADGAVRRVPAFVCWQGRSYPSLALAGLLAVDGGGAPQITRGRSWSDAPWRISLSRMPEFSLPLNEQGQIRVSYLVPRAGFVSISAVDIIERRAPADMLQGVWALVGSTAFGVGDAISTPHGGAVGGVEVHAQMLSAALDNRTPFTPSAGWAWPVFSCALALALLLLIASVGGRVGPNLKARPASAWAIPFFGVVLVGVFFALHAFALISYQLWLGWASQSLTVVLAAILLSAAELARLRWEKTRLFDNLASYLSEPVAREVGLSNRSEFVEAARRDVTVLCLSLRNFAAYAEKHSPEDAAQVLHQFVSMVNRVVLSLGGSIQQVHGVDILTVWPSDPQGASKHADSALDASLAMWSLCESLCQQWQTEQSIAGYLPDEPLLELGIGLECGDALVGSLGPVDRRLLTLLGVPVTVAQALQAMTSELAYPILVGPTAQSRLNPNGQQLTRLGEFLLPGTTTARIIYAAAVKFDAKRLHLVIGQGEQQLSA